MRSLYSAVQPICRAGETSIAPTSSIHLSAALLLPTAPGAPHHPSRIAWYAELPN